MEAGGERGGGGGRVSPRDSRLREMVSSDLAPLGMGTLRRRARAGVDLAHRTSNESILSE